MYTDAPDQVLRLSFEGAEFALKISGAAAKNIAAALYAVLKDQKRTKGKARITTMLRQQRPMTIYTIKKEDCSEFAKQARGYGVLYAPIPVKKGDDTVDVMVFQDDAARVNRIVERLELTVLDTASIRSELEPSLERERPQGKGPVPEKQQKDLFRRSSPPRTNCWMNFWKGRLHKPRKQALSCRGRAVLRPRIPPRPARASERVLLSVLLSGWNCGKSRPNGRRMARRWTPVHSK